MLSPIELTAHNTQAADNHWEVCVGGGDQQEM